MKCIRCGKPAEVNITQPFCQDCFIEHYERKVNRLIKRHNLISPKDKILVAVSGGKDSLSCAHVLHKLGYKISVLHVDVSIASCTNLRTKLVVEKFCEERNIPFYFTSFSEFLGISNMDEFFKKAKRPICSTCGMLKRYLFNKFARENGFDKIATGHCADDIVRYFLKSWTAGGKDNFEWLSKLKPLTPSSHPQMVARIRPLFESSEVENLFYTKFNEITVAGCSMCSFYGRDDVWTEILRRIDELRPDFKFNVVRSLEKIDILLKGSKGKEEDVIKECKICGEPTSSDICAVCKIKERMTPSIV